MTATADFLLDAKAAHAARRQYANGAETLAEKAVRLRQMNDPRARSMAIWANWLRRHGIEEAG